MTIGVLLYFMIPRSPKLAHFLNEDQRELAAARVEEELRHQRHEVVDRHQIKRALMAPTTWACGLGFFLTNITVQSFSLFLVSHTNDIIDIAHHLDRDGLHCGPRPTSLCPTVRLRLLLRFSHRLHIRPHEKTRSLAHNPFLPPSNRLRNPSRCLALQRRRTLRSRLPRLDGCLPRWSRFPCLGNE